MSRIPLHLPTDPVAALAAHAAESHRILDHMHVSDEDALVLAQQFRQIAAYLESTDEQHQQQRAPEVVPSADDLYARIVACMR